MQFVPGSCLPRSRHPANSVKNDFTLSPVLSLSTSADLLVNLMEPRPSCSCRMSGLAEGSSEDAGLSENCGAAPGWPGNGAALNFWEHLEHSGPLRTSEVAVVV